MADDRGALLHHWRAPHVGAMHLDCRNAWAKGSRETLGGLMHAASARHRHSECSNDGLKFKSLLRTAGKRRGGGGRRPRKREDRTVDRSIDRQIVASLMCLRLRVSLYIQVLCSSKIRSTPPGNPRMSLSVQPVRGSSAPRYVAGASTLPGFANPIKLSSKDRKSVV